MGTNEVSRRRDEMPAREEGGGEGGIKIKFI